MHQGVASIYFTHKFRFTKHENMYKIKTMNKLSYRLPAIWRP